MECKNFKTPRLDSFHINTKDISWRKLFYFLLLLDSVRRPAVMTQATLFACPLVKSFFSDNIKWIDWQVREKLPIRHTSNVENTTQRTSPFFFKILKFYLNDSRKLSFCNVVFLNLMIFYFTKDHTCRTRIYVRSKRFPCNLQTTLGLLITSPNVLYLDIIHEVTVSEFFDNFRKWLLEEQADDNVAIRGPIFDSVDIVVNPRGGGGYPHFFLNTTRKVVLFGQSWDRWMRLLALRSGTFCCLRV